MTRHQAIEKIAYLLYKAYEEVGMQEYTDPATDWACAERIYGFWDAHRRGRTQLVFITHDQYEDWQRFKPIVDEVPLEQTT